MSDNPEWLDRIAPGLNPGLGLLVDQFYWSRKHVRRVFNRIHSNYPTTLHSGNENSEPTPPSSKWQKALLPLEGACGIAAKPPRGFFWRM
jgi:hypothetical protein